VPFLQAAAAAASSSVLGDKHRMAAERRLLAIVGNDCRRKAFGDEILCVFQHHGQALATQVIKILATQMEAAPESRFGE